MEIIKINTCNECSQYLEDCTCCRTCREPEGHYGAMCPDLVVEETVISPAPKHSYIKTLVGVGNKKANNG